MRHVYLFCGESAELVNLPGMVERYSEATCWLKSKEALNVNLVSLGTYLMLSWDEGPSTLEVKVRYSFVKRHCDLK